MAVGRVEGELAEEVSRHEKDMAAEADEHERCIRSLLQWLLTAAAMAAHCCCRAIKADPGYAEHIKPHEGNYSADCTTGGLVLANLVCADTTPVAHPENTGPGYERSYPVESNGPTDDQQEEWQQGLGK